MPGSVQTKNMSLLILVVDRLDIYVKTKNGELGNEKKAFSTQWVITKYGRWLPGSRRAHSVRSGNLCLGPRFLPLRSSGAIFLKLSTLWAAANTSR